MLLLVNYRFEKYLDVLYYLYTEYYPEYFPSIKFYNFNLITFVDMTTSIPTKPLDPFAKPALDFEGTEKHSRHMSGATGVDRNPPSLSGCGPAIVFSPVIFSRCGMLQETLYKFYVGCLRGLIYDLAVVILKISYCCIALDGLEDCLTQLLFLGQIACHQIQAP